MVDFVTFTCPKSPYVGDGNGFSECFDDMLLGFAANVVSLLIISALGITGRNARRIRTMHLLQKVFLHFIPAIGACLSFLEVVLLLRKSISGDKIMHHLWFLRISQLGVWTIVLLFSTCHRWCILVYSRIFCFWWIMKTLLGIPHLLTTFSSFEVSTRLKESCFIVVDIMFGVSINIIRIKWASLQSRNDSSMNDPLLSYDIDLEEGHLKDRGNACGWWHLLTFESISSVMERGVVKQLDFEDLLKLPAAMEPSFCHDTLMSCWHDQQRNNSSNPSFFWAISSAYGWSYILLGVLKLARALLRSREIRFRTIICPTSNIEIISEVLNDCIGFAGPLLLNRLIRFLQQGSGHWNGYVFAISLGLTSLFKSFLDTQYTFHLAKLKLKLRSGIMTIIYQKCLCISLADRSRFSEGEIQTFMSIDADRTVNLCNSFHDVWSLPLQIGVAMYLLYTQVKFAFVSGVAITILLIPVNKWISNLIASATSSMMKHKDERIRRVGEFIAHIRTIKMYGWEILFTNRVMETRSLEMAHLSTRKYLDAWCVFFWATTPTLFSFCTFGLFTLMGHELDAAMVFTCLSLFNTLISPLNSFPWVINGLIDAFISMRRLSRFLSCPELKLELKQRDASSPSLLSDMTCDSSFNDMAVIIHDACCSWSSNDDEKQKLVLAHVDLAVQKGALVAIIGEVGSGKSSLLNSILGEMHLIQGVIQAFGSIAYVPQVPWILSGSVRDNVLFGKDYDQKRYSDVIEACALDVDISLMSGGDMAHIGEKGVNLSGGQRARLALARAIYHGSDIIMLDDVLSAVDAQVACWIVNNALLGPLMYHQTRVVCTHNIQAISAADIIVVMDKGHVKWVGSSADFAVSSYPAFFSLNELNLSSKLEVQGNRNHSYAKEGHMKEDNSCVSEQAQEIIEVEMRKEGSVELAVYKKYAAFSGWFITFAIGLSAILMQASRNGNDLWLSYWVDDTTGQTERSTRFYLVVLCIFCMVNSVITFARAFSFAFGGLRAAAQIHNTLLDDLVNAPVYFFDQTPGGRILNRFSSDLYTIDDSLPFILNILLANFVGLLGIAVVLSYVQVIFLFLLFPFWYIYRRLQFYYRASSRELRRLDSVSRSPIYASFSESLNGSSTIRAFMVEEIFSARFSEHVTLYQRTSYSEITASLWLSLRLQVLAAFVITFVALMAVIGSSGNFLISFGTPGLVGLALSYAAPIVSLLGSFLTSFTETEKEMVAVERVLQYMDLPEEQLQSSQSLTSNWPVRGEIEFQNVSIRYLPALPRALHDVSFVITGGMQVGIVGRTGAGKSSILNALFRLTPICGGRILVDDIDIANISVRDLRLHFSVVPQSPFLFEGSLRDNLDPLHVRKDDEIWMALDKCHVKDEVEVAGGLEIHVKESGTPFSVGQRQLLCLARALLKSSKVLCLDECTANVDTHTASILQSTISTECKGMTVITIAHRISTVLNMDNIIVLDQGSLVEQGNPQVLLQRSSRFSQFASASIM